jgi:serine/threonine-protein kinase HipA
MKSRQAIVRLDGQPVGILSEAGRTITFRYDPEWLVDPQAVPVSLTLPLTENPYETDGLHPYFENLLPEGWLLDLTTTSLKISKDDAFGLLIATCADCIGAVEILPLQEEVK